MPGLSLGKVTFLLPVAPRHLQVHNIWMKSFFLALLLVFPCIAADPRIPDLAQVDLELTLEQYKQARMDQFRSEMQLKLLQTEEVAAVGEETRKRLEKRSQILRNLADELRAKAVQVERDISE